MGFRATVRVGCLSAMATWRLEEWPSPVYWYRTRLTRHLPLSIVFHYIPVFPFVRAAFPNCRNPAGRSRSVGAILVIQSTENLSFLWWVHRVTAVSSDGICMPRISPGALDPTVWSWIDVAPLVRRLWPDVGCYDGTAPADGKGRLTAFSDTKKRKGQPALPLLLLAMIPCIQFGEAVYSANGYSTPTATTLQRDWVMSVPPGT